MGVKGVGLFTPWGASGAFGAFWVAGAGVGGCVRVGCWGFVWGCRPGRRGLAGCGVRLAPCRWVFCSVWVWGGVLSCWIVSCLALPFRADFVALPRPLFCFGWGP